MFVHSNEKKLLIFMFMFICWLLGKKKVLGTRACQTRVPYYKELELGKLENHRKKKKEHYARVLYLQRTRAW